MATSPRMLESMTNELQHTVRREIDQRLPRGPRGSDQNELRMRFNAWRLHGLAFEESVARGTEGVRQRNPAFQPVILPGPEPHGK